jgi:uncharacterized protein (DUF983 family)
MIKKGNKLFSIFWFKCPRCHEGDLFENQNPYSFRKFFDMPTHCSSCNLKYEPEPGFFYGAMYVSYALSISLAGLTWFILTMLDLEFWVVIWTVIPVLLISIPYLFKISRAIWINFFVHYKKEIKA